MPERILPAPDPFAICPLEGKVLEYYAGTFEAAYVLLHPFTKAESIDKEQCRPSMYPGRATIVRNYAPVSWAEVAERAELPSIAGVDIGLRTMIRGLKAELTNQEYADKIEALAHSNGILPPTEGFFSDLLHDRVLQSIQLLGYEWVWVGDEFGTERKLHWIDDLKGQETGPTTFCHCNVFTPDKQLLWTTHWDSHFSFLCSSERNLAAMQDACQFEGFFCTQSTEVYWSVRG
jgi:hypothetical protein